MSDRALQRFARLADEPLVPTASASRGSWTTLKAVIDHRALLGLLVRRDVKARYKDSALGMLWTLINPLVQLLIYWLVLGQILGAARGIPDFAIYIFSGLTIFGLFSETLSAATGSIVANSGLVKKVYVPREIFPLATAGSALVTFGVQLIVLVAACLILDSAPLSMGLLYFLPAVLIVVIYAVSLGILLSAINVYLRDVQYLTSILLMLALWSSPIVYGWTMVQQVIDRLGLPQWLLDVYSANPVTIAVLGFHRAFWVAGTPSDYPADLALRMGIAIVVGLLLLWGCQRVFSRLQGNFAQEL
ncbi:ABC transporter permease [Amnibacterium flavum]|uniref:Transport permease protein n=1 Tax=Amnibacterium flavum TaxID=2173173 RepID=A0A2V1HVS4_9MICO|nr:ABC transporter permease [Amnibacterium flavum]PVZ95862.1 sugar ABC transporter [Amnibacterium flavum]